MVDSQRRTFSFLIEARAGELRFQKGTDSNGFDEILMAK
jgi:hypothetical protein